MIDNRLIDYQSTIYHYPIEICHARILQSIKMYNFLFLETISYGCFSSCLLQPMIFNFVSSNQTLQIFLATDEDQFHKPAAVGTILPPLLLENLNHSIGSCCWDQTIILPLLLGTIPSTLGLCRPHDLSISIVEMVCFF